MKNLMKTMTVPGLGGTRRLTRFREESMRNARTNLARQTGSRSMAVDSTAAHPFRKWERPSIVT